MNKLVLSAIVGLALVGSGYAQSNITQQALSVSNNLPETAGEFKNQINNAVQKLTQVDVPAIVASLNIHTTGSVTKTTAQTFSTNVTFSGVVKVTDTEAPGTSILLVPNWTNQPAFVSSASHSTNAPRWVNITIGTNIYAFPVFQTF